MEHIFNRDNVGLVFLDDLRQALEYLPQPALQAITLREVNRAYLNTAQVPVRRLLNHTEAGVFAAAVDTHDPHATECTSRLYKQNDVEPNTKAPRLGGARKSS